MPYPSFSKSFALACLAICLAPWSGGARGEMREGVGEQRRETVLVLGRISDDPQQHYGQLKPLLDYVVPRMAEVGIVDGRVLMARDAQQMRSYLRRGRVDWVTETAAMAVDLSQRAGARPLLATERGGGGVYHTVFFTREGSGISELPDLRGRTLALQRSASTSAYLAPAVALLGASLSMELLHSPPDRPAADAVGYLFALSERNIAAWVQLGLVDAGAFSNLDWDRYAVGADGPGGLRVIHRTAPFPRAVELIRGDLDAAIAARLREVLLAAAADPLAAPALRRFFDTTGFRPFDDEARRLLAELGTGAGLVRRELE